MKKIKLINIMMKQFFFLSRFLPDFVTAKNCLNLFKLIFFLKKIVQETYILDFVIG